MPVVEPGPAEVDIVPVDVVEPVPAEVGIDPVAVVEPAEVGVGPAVEVVHQHHVQLQLPQHQSPDPHQEPQFSSSAPCLLQKKLGNKEKQVS